MNSWLLGRGRLTRAVRRSDLWFDSDGLRIHVYQYSQGSPRGKPALLVCHGRTTDSLELSGIAWKIAEYGWVAYNVEGRGRGQSEGGEEELGDEQGYLRDVLAFVDFVFTQPVNHGRVAVIGQSLGSGVAVIAAAKRPRLKACVALHPYSTYGFQTGPTLADEPDIRRPVDYVAAVSPRPLLIIAGEKDDALPVTLAHELYDAAGDPKRLLTIRDGTHSIEDTEMYALGWLLTNV